MPSTSRPGGVSYRLCPQCGRAVPQQSGERYCANDGHLLLDACPQCEEPIASPYTRFCTCCGAPLILAVSPPAPLIPAGER